MLRWILRKLFKLVFWGVMLIALVTVFFAFLNPIRTPYMIAEARRLDRIEADWVPIEEMASIVPLAAVAGEDAKFCSHWGFDLDAILDAVRSGGQRGGSTISQQTVKNVYLWQGRSYVRKALEAMITPVAELIWSKQRMLEIYLNVAEFDTGVFGIEAAAWHHFGVSSLDLSDRQAALLIAVLPNPKGWSAVSPSATTNQKANRILSGAQTIAADGRAACFQ